MLKKFIVAEKISGSQKHNALIKRINKIDAEYIALDIPAIHFCVKTNKIWHSSDEYFTPEKRKITAEKCVLFAREWHKDNNPLVYKDINLASSLETRVILQLFKIHEIWSILEVVKKEGYSKIYCFVQKDTWQIIKSFFSISELKNVKPCFIAQERELFAYTRDIARFIFSSLWRQIHNHKPRRGYKNILFYECLDRIGNVAELSKTKMCPAALYPFFSKSIFTQCRKQNILYLVLNPGLFFKNIWGVFNKQKTIGQMELNYNDIFPFIQNAGLIFSHIINNISRELRVLVNCIDSLEQEIGNYNLLVTSNDTLPLSKTITMLAKKHNVMTLVIQHGVTTGGLISKINGSSVFGVGFLPVISDYFAAAGQISRNWLIENGVEPKKIIPTGLPLLDKYLNASIPRTEKSKLCIKFGLDINKPIVLFAGQHSNKKSRFAGYHLTPYEIYTTLVSLAKAIGHNNQFNLIVKMHPASDDSESIYADIFKQEGLRDYTIIKNYPVKELLSISDIVITPWSTIGVEAIFMQKPLITVNFTGMPDKMPYAEMGVAKRANSIEDIKELLQYFLENGTLPIFQDDLKSFKNLYNSILNRTAADNIVSLILDITEKHEKKIYRCCCNSG